MRRLHVETRKYSKYCWWSPQRESRHAELFKYIFGCLVQHRATIKLPSIPADTFNKLERSLSPRLSKIDIIVPLDGKISLHC